MKKTWQPVCIWGMGSYFYKTVCFFRRCYSCGSFFKQSDPFCEECWCELLSRPKSGRLESVLYWTNSSQGEKVRSLIYYLKNFDRTHVFRRLALYLNPPPLKPERIIFVPAPSKVPGEKDHAYWWASELARLWQGDVFTGLERQFARAQKSLKREQRQGIKIRCNEELPSGDRTIVFCDDLITTGATARAAYIALGSPKNFRIWTIAERPRLPGG